MRDEVSTDHAGPPPTLHRHTFIWIALMAAALIAFLLELVLGATLIPVRTLVAIVMGRATDAVGERQVLLLFRLPRAMPAALSGAALGVSGLSMQTLFRNPLADPFVLGISSGASLGVAVVVLVVGGSGLGLLLEHSSLLGVVSINAAAILGALAVLGAVLWIARSVESSLTLLIIGLMFGYITGSLVSILMQFSTEHQTQGYINWMFGSFASVTWRQMSVFAPTIGCGLLLACILSKALNAFLLGEGYARSLGVNVRQSRFRIILCASILAGAVTAYCGPIGFLGIAVPHLCRMLFRTSDHRQLLPAVILLGAALALAADLISMAPGSGVALPLNAITALIGAPVVVGMILSRSHVMEAGA